MPRSVRKTARKSKSVRARRSRSYKMESSPSVKCEYPATMHGLKHWYEAMFEKLGWMILAKKKQYTEKVSSYVISLDRLHEKLICKIGSIRDQDKKNDLMIMLDNVKILIDHAKKDLA